MISLSDCGVPRNHSGFGLASRVSTGRAVGSRRAYGVGSLLDVGGVAVVGATALPPIRCSDLTPLPPARRTPVILDELRHGRAVVATWRRGVAVVTSWKLGALVQVRRCGSPRRIWLLGRCRRRIEPDPEWLPRLDADVSVLPGSPGCGQR
jgi:hypothetical protein